MQISSLQTGAGDPATLGKKTPSLPISGAAASKTTAPAGAAKNSTNNAALTNILSQYDITNISPTEFSAMLRKLHDSGAVSTQEMSNLTQIRGDLDRAGVASNETVNLPEFYQKQLQQLQQSRQAITGTNQAAVAQRSAIGQQIAAVQTRYDWVQKVAAMHDSSGSEGVDLAA
jgi:hypothetical protein